MMLMPMATFWATFIFAILTVGTSAWTICLENEGKSKTGPGFFISIVLATCTLAFGIGLIFSTTPCQGMGKMGDYELTCQVAHK